MSVLNIPRNEQEALKKVDLEDLRKRIRQCINEEKSYGLRDLRLDVCGFSVITQIGIFERALEQYCQSKMPKKRAETLHTAERAGRALIDIISNLQEQVQTQQRERLLFYVEDQIMPPGRFSNKISVQIRYQWRKAPEDNWNSGSITFSHDVKPQYDFMAQQPTRKLSAAREEQERQDSLYKEWEYLKGMALFSVREYFRNGGDGKMIPDEIKAVVDQYTKQLNNFSTRF